MCSLYMSKLAYYNRFVTKITTFLLFLVFFVFICSSVLKKYLAGITSIDEYKNNKYLPSKQKVPLRQENTMSHSLYRTLVVNAYSTKSVSYRRK